MIMVMQRMMMMVLEVMLVKEKRKNISLSLEIVIDCNINALEKDEDKLKSHLSHVSCRRLICLPACHLWSQPSISTLINFILMISDHHPYHSPVVVIRDPLLLIWSKSSDTQLRTSSGRPGSVPFEFPKTHPGNKSMIKTYRQRVCRWVMEQ